MRPVKVISYEMKIPDRADMTSSHIFKSVLADDVDIVFIVYHSTVLSSDDDRIPEVI